MKGKTGKPAMRGGGLARKGMGAALKGGGIARKGTGSNATPGGKTAKMAMGGSALGPAVGPGTGIGSIAVKPIPGRMPAFPGRPGGRPIGAGEPGRGAGFGDRGPNIGFGMQKHMTPIGPRFGGVEPRLAPMPMNPPGGGVEPRWAPMPMNRKHGGKVAKYAKGGAVKMTAGAGSGSGRLEKVAAHKAAPRVKAVGLKKGGKVKGK